MLVDTDVIIWNLRGLAHATQRLDQISSFNISATTWLELLQGFRNRAEILAVKKSLENRNANCILITPAITELAVALMERLTFSHGLQLGDAHIAATAIEHKLTLLTSNVKHFSAISELTIERFEP